MYKRYNTWAKYQHQGKKAHIQKTAYPDRAQNHRLYNMEKTTLEHWGSKTKTKYPNEAQALLTHYRVLKPQYHNTDL